MSALFAARSGLLALASLAPVGDYAGFLHTLELGGTPWREKCWGGACANITLASAVPWLAGSPLHNGPQQVCHGEPERKADLGHFSTSNPTQCTALLCRKCAAVGALLPGPLVQLKFRNQPVHHVCSCLHAGAGAGGASPVRPCPGGAVRVTGSAVPCAAPACDVPAHLSRPSLPTHSAIVGAVVVLSIRPARAPPVFTSGLPIIGPFLKFADSPVGTVREAYEKVRSPRPASTGLLPTLTARLLRPLPLHSMAPCSP